MKEGEYFRMSEGEKDKKTIEPTLEPLLQAHIGKQLRDMFGSMAREPVPDKFRRLLDRLEAGEQASTPPDADDEATAL
jgi:Anti-sigma factor NepR